MEYVDSIELLATGNGQSSLRSTPLQTVNDKSGGTGDGEVTIITGPPSSGKSILGKQFALHYMQEHKFPALIFTAEMPYQQWMNRAVCEIGKIPFKSFREGRLNAHEMTSLSTTISRLSKMPLQVYDRKRIKFTKNALESVIRHEAKTSGAKFILLDYLQKVTTSRKKDQRTDEAIGEVSDMLKDVAVQFGLHVFILASENDDGSVRSSREPEYDADNILKLMVKTEKNDKTGNPMIITDKIICKKWRDAERGYTVRVEMEGKYCRFRDITGENG
jgi:replicative DNA helicase